MLSVEQDFSSKWTPCFNSFWVDGAFLFDKLAFAASIEMVEESKWAGATAEVQFCLLVK